MRAILIQAPCWDIKSPPYNLALLKAVAEKQGHRIKCMDLNILFYQNLKRLNQEHLYEKSTNWYSDIFVKTIIAQNEDFIAQQTQAILKEGSPVVGFSTTGLSIFFAREFARRIKQQAPEKIIIFGGPACFKNEWGARILEIDSHIDYVCLHEGEKVLPDLLTHLEQFGPMTALKGIAYRAEQIVNNGQENMIQNLNDLPFADYSDFSLDDYLLKELPLSTSRGCIYRCLFCSESQMWDKYRFRQAENIFQEILYQRKRYPSIRSFFFNDSLFNGNIPNLKKLAELIVHQHVPVLWGGQAAIRKEMTPEFLQLLKRSGLSHVSYGLETASERVLKIIGKRFTPEIAEQVLRDTKMAGIRTDVNIVVGFPGETEKDIIASAEFLKRNRMYIDEIFFHPLVIAPGSYYHARPEEWGIVIQQGPDPYNNWFIENSENTLTKRLELLNFYQEYIGRAGESFFNISDYYLSAAEQYYSEDDYPNALKYYKKAKELNKNKLKEPGIEERIKLINNKIACS